MVPQKPRFREGLPRCGQQRCSLYSAQRLHQQRTRHESLLDERYVDCLARVEDVILVISEGNPSDCCSRIFDRHRQEAHLDFSHSSYAERCAKLAKCVSARRKGWNWASEKRRAFDERTPSTRPNHDPVGQDFGRPGPARPARALPKTGPFWDPFSAAAGPPGGAANEAEKSTAQAGGSPPRPPSAALSALLATGVINLLSSVPG